MGCFYGSPENVSCRWLLVSFIKNSVLALESCSKFPTLSPFSVRKSVGAAPLENNWSDGYKVFRLQSLYISGLDLQVLRKQSNHKLKSLLTYQNL